MINNAKWMNPRIPKNSGDIVVNPKKGKGTAT
jgi:hypothetical protein